MVCMEHHALHHDLVLFVLTVTRTSGAVMVSYLSQHPGMPVGHEVRISSQLRNSLHNELKRDPRAVDQRKCGCSAGSCVAAWLPERLIIHCVHAMFGIASGSEHGLSLSCTAFSSCQCARVLLEYATQL
jgi:hypothetical protein